MDKYNAQDGLKYYLQRRFNGDHPFDDKRQEFPDGRKNFPKMFSSFEDYMNDNYHKNVELGAAINGDGLLTNHGIEHVQDVIRHAGDIIDDINQLTGYEIFILLISIHFHDVGNLYGREEHEQKIDEIIEKLDTILPLDTAGKNFVNAIATAHGGYYKNDKDTIRHIGDDCKYANVLVRQKALAAILRFADEISDDFTRSNFSGKIPEGNEVYHEYSKSLEPVSIEGDAIILHFRIPYNLTKEKVGKGTSKVFLYDEILNRIAKCMRELEYCKKYADGLIKLKSISVKIDILREGSNFKIIENAGDSFRLTLQGYPNEDICTLESYLETPSVSNDMVKKIRYKDGIELSKAELEE